MNPVQPWHIQSYSLNHRTGSQIFAALFGSYLRQLPRPDSIVALLESPYPLPVAAQPHAHHARYSICGGPPRLIAGQPQVWTSAVGEILPTLRQLYRPLPDSLLGPEADLALATLPFTGGWLGWLGYDLAWEIEQLPRHNQDPLPLPVALWYEPASFAVLDHQEQVLWLAASSPTDLAILSDRLRQPSPPWPPIPDQDISPLHFELDQAAYEAAVRQAQKHIWAGDIFQANLSLRFETHTQAHGWQLYQRLQQINPSPFACYWYTPWGQVISCSPERLIQLRGDRAQTRPIAGTRPRGTTPQQDQQYAQTLHTHPKERAEHIMLVDLERNDLGRVCIWGSVQVDELLTLEYYSHVIHLVSNVVGTLQPQRDPVDLIQALFPGGTITGCPKVRCMEIIEALEPVRRSLFYGSCGYLDCQGNLDLNILIRTLLVEATPDRSSGALQTVWGQVGAGIVADSCPAREWLESLQKAQAQLMALGLIPNSSGNVTG